MSFSTFFQVLKETFSAGFYWHFHPFYMPDSQLLPYFLRLFFVFFCKSFYTWFLKVICKQFSNFFFAIPAFSTCLFLVTVALITCNLQWLVTPACFFFVFFKAVCGNVLEQVDHYGFPAALRSHSSPIITSSFFFSILIYFCLFKRWQTVKE